MVTKNNTVIVSDTAQFYPHHTDSLYREGAVFAAIVTMVKDDGTVNLAVFARNGSGIFGRVNIPWYPEGTVPEIARNGYAMAPTRVATLVGYFEADDVDNIDMRTK